jgi:hypothetical protein
MGGHEVEEGPIQKLLSTNIHMFPFLNLCDHVEALLSDS